MATRDDALALEQDAQAVLLMAAELVARARRDGVSADDATAMARAREALAKPFASASKREAERELWPVVQAVAEVYRALPQETQPKALERALTAALNGFGYQPDNPSLALLAAEHERIKEHRGPSEAAKVAVGQVGPALVNERRRRLGLTSAPLEPRGKNTVGNWQHLEAPTPATGHAAMTALELLLVRHADGTLDEALEELRSPTNLEEERAWVTEQSWGAR